MLVSLSLLLSQDNMTTAKSAPTPSAIRRRISDTRPLVAKVNPKEFLVTARIPEPRKTTKEKRRCLYR